MKIKIEEIVKGRFAFFCPACECIHAINSNWQFNGDKENPTINPSILAIGNIRCHSYVKEGKIRFLNDCDHKLKGQTVELPEFIQGA